MPYMVMLKNRGRIGVPKSVLLYGENCMIPTSTVFTAQCTLVQIAVLRLHVIRLSICDVGGL